MTVTTGWNAEEEDRLQRFTLLRQAMEENPPDSEYHAEALNWQQD